MSHTSMSLLSLLQRDDQEAWNRVLEIYQPLIGKWLSRFGAPRNEVNDLCQTVLTVVFRKVSDFEHRGQPGSFRAWMRTITHNCLLDFWRNRKAQPIATGKTSFHECLNQLADEHSALSQQWNREFDEHVLSTLLERIRPEFSEQTWSAFMQTTIENKRAADAARSLGVTVNAIFIAKSRVMARLRQVGKNLIDL